MPPTVKPPPSSAAATVAASETSPAPPTAEGGSPLETGEAGVRAREEADVVKMMEVEDRGEVEPDEDTEGEPVEEDPDEEEPVEEDPDKEEPVEEDPDEEVDEDAGDSEEAVLAVGTGDGTAPAADSEKLVIKEGGDEEKAVAMVSKESGGDDTEMEPAVVEEPEELEGAEEEKLEEDVRKEDAAKVLGEGVTVDDMKKIPEEEHEESGDEGAHEDNDKDVGAGQLIADGDVQNDELDPSLLVLGQVSVVNAKDLQIFVGGLPTDCAEEDIAMVFSQFGEIESIKIIKHSARKKRKCVALVRYMNTEAAKKALTEFKEGVEVKGESVRLSASQSNNTLYLGNICMSWTKDQVINTLKSIGIEEFEMSLPNNPDTGGRNRGFAFLKFATHDNVEAAFEQLKKHCASSGIYGSAEESGRTPSEPSDELTKVKTVYLEGVPLSWDETEIKECCKGYGTIRKVRLLKRKKKILSFIKFSSRMSALACVEGIKNANIGGEVKLAASLARPPRKMQLDKKGAEAGREVNGGATSKDTDKSKKKNDKKNDVLVKKNSLHKLPKSDVTASKLISRSEVEPQTPNPSKGKRKAGKSKDTFVKERPSKKAQKNHDVLSRSSNKTCHGGYARAAYAGEWAENMKHSAGPRHATSNQAYRNVGATSRSKPNARDLEPHAGYILPAKHLPADRVQITYVYDQPRAVPSNIHRINVLPYAREIADPPAYSVYTSNPRYQGGYAQTYLPPPPLNGSYHPGGGAYSPGRRYY